jgi:hypothetical protein
MKSRYIILTPIFLLSCWCGQYSLNTYVIILGWPRGLMILAWWLCWQFDNFQDSEKTYIIIKLLGGPHCYHINVLGESDASCWPMWLWGHVWSQGFGHSFTWRMNNIYILPTNFLTDKKISASFPMNNVCACNHCKLCDQYLSMKIFWFTWWNQISFHKLLQSSIPWQINKDKIHHRIGIWTTRIKVLHLLACMRTYLTISCHLFP